MAESVECWIAEQNPGEFNGSWQSEWTAPCGGQEQCQGKCGPALKAANVLQNKLTLAQYLDEVTWTTKNWLGLQKQRISVVLHTAIAEQIVNELACGEGGRVHGAKCLAVLAGVA